MKNDNQTIVHCVQIEPGCMIVSEKLMTYTKHHTNIGDDHEKIGELFGVDIITSDFLPFVLEKDNENV